MEFRFESGCEAACDEIIFWESSGGDQGLTLWLSTVLRYVRSLTRYSVSGSDSIWFNAMLGGLLTGWYLLVDVPMSRVKFNVNTEYAYLQNFKILQSTLSSDPLVCFV